MIRCPFCGEMVEPMPYFDVRKPETQKQAFLHTGGKTDCPLRSTEYLYRAYNTDCLMGMQLIPDKTIDLILCDLPYGTTHNKWDSVIPFFDLWAEYTRIIKDNGAILLFADGFFMARLMESNPMMWRYNLVWDKVLSTGFLNANKQPLRVHEEICVFYIKPPVYHPQKIEGKKNHSKGKPKGCANNNYGSYGFQDNQEALGSMKHPTSILRFQKPHPSKAIHPTQKPVDLLMWCIKSYTNEGDVVLDNCFGSGSTLEAALTCNRACIGFEKEESYFQVAAERLRQIGGFNG